MSSPSATGATKRPLDDASSPHVKDEHDSKRPALDKDHEDHERQESPSPEAKKGEDEEAVKNERTDIDTVVPDAPDADADADADAHQDSSTAPVDETQWIHIRSLITSAEAATIIGKGGENVTLIRRMAEAKCTVSEYQRGAGERILTVSGAVDAVAKVSNIVPFCAAFF